MNKKNRHQRRRRQSGKNKGWLWNAIVLPGQATYYVVRLWFWFTDRE